VSGHSGSVASLVSSWDKIIDISCHVESLLRWHVSTTSNFVLNWLWF
jgi:hypothetical protein